MRDARRRRRLALPDGTAYRWTVRHRHTPETGCAEVLTLSRDGAVLRIVFRDGAGRVLGTGAAYAHSGLVCDEHGHSANLHRPSVVRAFVDEVRRRGATAGELDGWELLPAVSGSGPAAGAAQQEGGGGRSGGGGAQD
ncbi:hypothetical protein [Streptomyces sp. NPDC047024]|uniref:hypothetical protein n=1 Tax=Streptomyces sp. NPDC047024 TaxID=3155476 RepID=UPI00340599F5